jgi:hypothetical protein
MGDTHMSLSGPSGVWGRKTAGLPRLLSYSMRGLGRASWPVACRPWRGNAEAPHLATYLLVRACQQLWLDEHHGLYQHFTWVDPAPRSWPPTALCCWQSPRPLTLLRPAPKSRGYVAPRASDKAVTRDACRGGRPLTEQGVTARVLLDQVLHGMKMRLPSRINEWFGQPLPLHRSRHVLFFKSASPCFSKHSTQNFLACNEWRNLS